MVVAVCAAIPEPRGVKWVMVECWALESDSLLAVTLVKLPLLYSGDTTTYPMGLVEESRNEYMFKAEKVPRTE